jgi:hypothetical protein
MTLTKHNISEHIQTILREKRIKYVFLNEYSDVDILELFISHIPAYIQFDYSKDDDSFILQLYTEDDRYYFSEYYSECKNCDGVDIEIDNLINSVKTYVKLINKIEKKIDEIRELCSEHDLDIEKFITINFDSSEN